MVWAEHTSAQWAQFDRQVVFEYSHSEAAEAARLQAIEENSPLIERLRRRGLKVLIDAPKPVFPAPPFRCSDRFNQMNPVCTGGFGVERDSLLKMRAPVMRSLDTLSERFDNVYLWDPFPILCPASSYICTPFDADGRPLFFDGDHLSGRGNSALYPHFARELLRILASD